MHFLFQTPRTKLEQILYIFVLEVLTDYLVFYIFLIGCYTDCTVAFAFAKSA